MGILNAVISKIKGETYVIDKDLSIRLILGILVGRGTSLLKGQIVRFRIKKSSWLIFVGKNLILKGASKIIAGKSLTIKNNVLIDATSVNGIKFGNNVTICNNVIIECTGVIRDLGEGLIIGDRSSVGDFSFIGSRGLIEIGNDVLIGPRVSFHSENHKFDILESVIRIQGEERKGIKIEDNCWIGSGSIILDGVTIEEGSIVAAGSVVTKNVKAFSVVGGVPAKLIKSRIG